MYTISISFFLVRHFFKKQHTLKCISLLSPIFMLVSSIKINVKTAFTNNNGLNSSKWKIAIILDPKKYNKSIKSKIGTCRT